MNHPNIEETNKPKPQEILLSLPKMKETNPMLCGPGCDCGQQTKISQWRIVIMLIILAAVAIAFLYKIML